MKGITFPSHLYYSEESLLCVLASEDQRNDETQQTYYRYNSKNTRNPEFFFQNWQKENSQRCAEFCDAGSKATCCSAPLRRKQYWRERKRG